MNTDYLITKSILEQKALDLASHLRHIEEQMDDLYKINLYLIRKYKDDLIQDLNIQPIENMPEQFYGLLSLFPGARANEEEFIQQYYILAAINKIKDIMKEEMPDPWYCYSYGNV